VTITPQAAAQLERLPIAVRVRMTRVFQRLEGWPSVSGAKPLRGRLAGWYRIRTGDYRVRFRVRGETVVVDGVGHREGFYDE